MAAARPAVPPPACLLPSGWAVSAAGPRVRPREIDVLPGALQRQIVPDSDDDESGSEAATLLARGLPPNFYLLDAKAKKAARAKGMRTEPRVPVSQPP